MSSTVPADFARAAMIRAEGDPGAMTALIALRTAAPKIDPGHTWAAYICWVDLCGLAGPRLSVFYRVVCGGNVNRMAILLRAAALDIVDPADIGAAVDAARADLASTFSYDAVPGASRTFAFWELMGRVRMRVPTFARYGEKWL